MTQQNNLFIRTLMLALICAGCATTMQRVSQRNLPLPVAETVNHTKDVMNDYDFDIQLIDPKNDATHMKGKHVDGQEVEVDITPISKGTSQIKIQVTNQAPRTSAKTILDHIAVRHE